MVYPALLPLMRTPRLPVVDWTDAPADLNGLVRFAERRKIWFLRVCHHISKAVYRVCFSGVKRPVAWRWPPTPSNAEVKERVELYLYSPSGPSWLLLAWTLFCFTLNTVHATLTRILLFHVKILHSVSPLKYIFITQTLYIFIYSPYVTYADYSPLLIFMQFLSVFAFSFPLSTFRCFPGLMYFAHFEPPSGYDYIIFVICDANASSPPVTVYTPVRNLM